MDKLLAAIDKKLKFGTVVHGPGKLRYFGFNITQHEDKTCVIDADDKLEKPESGFLTRLRRKDVDYKLNELEKITLMSINSSLGWLGTTVSPFCSAASSRLQQCLPDARVSALINQKAVMQELKRLGTSVRFGRPSDKNNYSISMLVFADAGRPPDSAQISPICRLLIGSIDQDSFFHTVSWTSHKSKRPVRSIAAGEILAAGEGIDEGLMLKRTYSLSLE